MPESLNQMYFFIWICLNQNPQIEWIIPTTKGCIGRRRKLRNCQLICPQQKTGFALKKIQSQNITNINIFQLKDYKIN